jgi:hypothetical protein
MKTGIRHLIQCHCVLPQYRKRKEPIFHKFLVFSTLNNEVCESKLAQCNNCNQLHKVIDLCRSEFLNGKDETKAIPTEIDIGLSISDKLKEVLESYDCDISLWEHAQFIEENEIWGSKLILSKESDEENIQIKSLNFISSGKFKITTDSFQETIGE